MLNIPSLKKTNYLYAMIALTGSTGFVGSHLLLELLKRNEIVIAIKRSNSDVSYTKHVFELHDNAELFNKIQWVNCDLSQFHDVVEIFNGVDIVLHTAAQVNLNKTNRKSLINNNVKITENVANAALLQQVKRFGYVSSIATITNSLNGKGIENSPFEILTTYHPYTLSKCLAELEIWRSIQEGLPAVIINPSVILGYSRQWNVYASMVNRLKKGMLYYPKGKGSFVDISDVVKILLHLTLNTSITNQRFILTSENISYHDFYKHLCDLLSINKELKPINKEKLFMLGYLGEIMSVFSKNEASLSLHTAKLLNKELAYSNEKICDTLQCQFIPVKESLRIMTDWYKLLSI